MSTPFIPIQCKNCNSPVFIRTGSIRNDPDGLYLFTCPVCLKQSQFGVVQKPALVERPEEAPEMATAHAMAGGSSGGTGRWSGSQGSSANDQRSNVMNPNNIAYRGGKGKGR